MPNFFQKPENALKRADEFDAVGKPDEALEVLYDFIKSRKHRTWQKTHEPIMYKYLDLCVNLKKSHPAKEGLYQYKIISQNVNVQSLIQIIEHYLKLAEQRTEAARVESKQTCEDVDDLDTLQSPESLLLAAVSAEDAQDRTDRAILTPWVRFLWESYRQCLELLRNNNKVERLYHSVAKQAFDFCLKYTRKTEFRKLCEHLRNHLKNIIEKGQSQQSTNPNLVNILNPETLVMHLETRLAQLDAAIQMELWLEAYKAVEDIHDLITRSKKAPRPALLSNYYEKFALVFWKSNNHLFHAAACHKLFLLISELRKNPSQEEINRIANRVLLSTVSIPLPPTRYAIDQLLESNDAEKRRRLASLLSLSVAPTRQSLVKDLAKNNVLNCVSPELRTLYNDLEVEFDPLNLSKKIQASIEFVRNSNELSQYAQSLQDISVIRVIKQVAQVYQVMELKKLRELVPFVSAFEMEKIILQAAKNIGLPVRLDHKTQTVRFGTDLSSCLQEDIKEGPFLQHMPGEQLRNQLQHMAKALSKAMDKLALNANQEKEAVDMKLRIIDAFRRVEGKERERILKRKRVIESRKEEREKISKQQDEQEAAKLREEQKKLKDAEEKRLKREMEEREQQRVVEERDLIRRKEAEKRIEQLKTTDIGQRALEGLTEEELAELDTDDIMKKQVEQLEKENKELQERLKSQEKKVDYFIRARRLEEIPFLEEHAKELSKSNREQFEQQETARIEALKQERANAVKNKDRLTRIGGSLDGFLNKLKEARYGDYKEKLVEFEKHLSEVRKERLDERRLVRIDERRQKAIQELEEKKRREREETLRKQREEERRKEREEQEKLAELAEQRKAEAEAKLLREKEERTAPYFQRSGAPGGGWREREAAKHESWRRKEDGGSDAPDGGWRTGTAGGGREERAYDDRGPRRNDRGFDDGPRRDDRSFDDRPRRDDRSFDDRPRRDDRGFGSREERTGGFGGRDRGGRPDDRGPPRRDDRYGDDRGGGSSWRDRQSDEPRRGDRFNRDDQRAVRGEERDDWRRSGVQPRGGDRDQRSDRGSNRSQPADDNTAWRRGGLPPAREPERRRDDQPTERRGDDGWNIVQRK